MKQTNFLFLLAIAAIVISSSSCTQYPAPNTKTGAVIGGLVGAGAGAIIGHQSGRGLEGAAIGGAAGAVGGGLIGSAKDDRERQYNDQNRGYNDQNQNRRPYYDQNSNGGYPEPRDAGEYYQHPRRNPRYYY